MNAILPQGLPAEVADGAVPRPGHSPNVLLASANAPAEFVRGLADSAKRLNWRLISDMVHTGVMPTRWDGDGAITFAARAMDITDYFVGARIPFVTVSLSDECLAVPRVQPDNPAIGTLAARHLLELGCRQFIWAPFNDDPWTRERLQGFRAVLAKERLDCFILPPAHRRIGHTWHDNWREWREAAATLLEAARGHAGLFASNDCLAAKILLLAQETGIAVPDELAVVGVGNDPLDCESAAVSVSSVDPDLAGMTRRAADLLHDIMTRGRRPDEVWHHPPLAVNVRESTGVNRHDKCRLSQAVTYIAAHCDDPALSVTVVADRVGVSRRQLERDFRTSKGCTVRQFIEDTRMQKAAELIIAHPQAKILAVAGLIGVTDPNRFFRQFRKKFGTTPAAFRRQAIADAVRRPLPFPATAE